MPSGTRIERLFLSLGLDITEFDRDLAGAQQHVRQATASLGRDLRMQRLRMEIELAGINNADSSVRGLGVRLGHLKTQMETQRNSVALLNHAYQESVRQLGANAAASRNLQERLTREQLAEARLAQQIRQTNQARRERVTNNVSDGVNGTAVALAPTVVAGGAALKLAVDAVESENLWRESMGKMKAEGDEWSKGLRSELGLNEFELRKSTGMLNTMFESMGMGTEKSYELATGIVKLGYDMASFYNLPTDQAFEKLRAGMTGESEPLKALGILVDDTTVKNYAYMNSITQQGAELTAQEKVLARYGAIMDQTKRAQGDMARTLNDPSNAIRVLKSNVEQLGIEFGQTLIPTLQEFLKTGKSIVDWYNNADAGSKLLTNSMAKTAMEAGAAATALTALGMAARMVNPWVALAAAVGLATKGTADYLLERKKIKEFEDSKNLSSDPSALNAKLRLNPDTGEIEKEISRTITILGYKVPRLPIWIKLEGVEKAEAELQAARASWASLKGDNPVPDLDKLRAEIESNRQRDADNAKRQAAIEKQAAAERLKINQELSADLYKLTHTDIENQLHDIELKAAEFRKQKADEVNIVAWAEAAKNKIMEDSSRELNDAIYNISHSFLQNRLHDIETERQAWIKKNGDEVKATQLAEQEKLKAVKDAVYAEYGDEIRAVAEARKNGKDVGEAYAKAHAETIKGKEADKFGYDYIRERNGIYMPGDLRSTAVIDGNSAYQKNEYVQKNSFDESKFRGLSEDFRDAIQSLQSSSQQIPQVSQAMANIQANTPAVNNNQFVSRDINISSQNAIELKGFTSDEITKAVERAKDAFGKEIYSAIQDAKTQYGV